MLVNNNNSQITRVILVEYQWHRLCLRWVTSLEAVASEDTRDPSLRVFKHRRSHARSANNAASCAIDVPLSLATPFTSPSPPSFPLSSPLLSPSARPSTICSINNILTRLLRQRSPPSHRCRQRAACLTRLLSRPPSRGRRRRQSPSRRRSSAPGRPSACPRPRARSTSASVLIRDRQTAPVATQTPTGRRMYYRLLARRPRIVRENDARRRWTPLLRNSSLRRRTTFGWGVRARRRQRRSPWLLP
jgi:hypothetical protein